MVLIMRKGILCLAAALLLMSLLPRARAEEEPAISARCAVLMGPEGQILYDRNADERCLIASTTKLMTALVVAERCEAGETVEIPAACCGIEGSSLYLSPGDRYTVEELLTGLLLAYNIPADAPTWLPLIGGIIAIVLVKQIYGGLGSNFMNPALTARAILFISWSSLMTTYPAPLDGVSGATPLATLASGTEGVAFMDLFLGRCGGVLGETCKLAILLGGLYLIIRKVIDWRIPVLMIGTVFVCYLLKDGPEAAVLQIFSGGLMLGAFFMATDYATSPITPLGRTIFAVLCGLILFVIRAFANYPEGCSFAILFMNVMTPLIDHFTLPTPFGEVKKNG